MWHTQEGDRVLTGEEAKLFLASLRFMVDILEDDDLEETWAFRVEVFDRLTLGQKLTMLRDVAQALLDPTIPMPELSAVNEGTVAAIYQNLLDNTLMEIEEDKDTQLDQSFRYYWRSLIMAAAKEADQAEDVPPDPDWNPTIESNAMGDWDVLVAYLENRILWDDADWDLEEEIADSPPELAQHQKEFLGITDDYFLAVAPDPPENEIPQLIDEIQKLCGPEVV